jgi:hypothetical protein
MGCVVNSRSTVTGHKYSEVTSSSVIYGVAVSCLPAQHMHSPTPVNRREAPLPYGLDPAACLRAFRENPEADAADSPSVSSVFQRRLYRTLVHAGLFASPIVRRKHTSSQLTSDFASKLYHRLRPALPKCTRLYSDSPELNACIRSIRSFWCRSSAVGVP